MFISSSSVANDQKRQKRSDCPKLSIPGHKSEKSTRLPSVAEFSRMEEPMQMMTYEFFCWGKGVKGGGYRSQEIIVWDLYREYIIKESLKQKPVS